MQSIFRSPSYSIPYQSRLLCIKKLSSNFLKLNDSFPRSYYLIYLLYIRSLIQAHCAVIITTVVVNDFTDRHITGSTRGMHKLIAANINTHMFNVRG